MVSRRTYVILLLSLFATSIFAGKKLSDRELLLQTSWCLESTSHDAPVIQTLHQASRRYHIPELATYAHIRQKLVIDTCNRHALACHKSLIAYSDSIYGKVSYESVYLRLYSLSSIMLPESWKEHVEQAYTLAQELYRQNPTDENKELLLFSRYFHLKDNDLTGRPDLLLDVVYLMKEAEELYRTRPRSDLKRALYMDAGSYFMEMLSLYSDYENALGAQFAHDTALIALFDVYTDSIYTHEKLPIYVSTNYFWKESLQCTRELHQNSPMDMLAEEINFLYIGTSYEGQEERIVGFIEHGYQQFVKYHGEHHPITASAHILMRTIASRLNQTVPPYCGEDTIMAAYLLPDGVHRYIGIKFMELTLQTNNTLKLRALCRELRELGDQYFQDDAAERLYAYSGEFFLQRKARGYENVFSNLVAVYERESKRDISWNMIALGKNLTVNAEQVYSNIDDAIKIEFCILKMMQQLVSDTSLIFKSEYMNYLCMAIKAYPLQPKNLDGTIGMDKLIASVEEAVRNTPIHENFHLFLGQYYFNAGRFENAKEQFLIYLDELHKIQKDKDEWYGRIAEMGTYGNLASIFAYLNPETPDTSRYYIAHLDTLYHKYANPAFIPATKTLAEYYDVIHEWDKAEEVVDFALQQYENAPQALWDGTYSMLMRMRVQLLLGMRADINQCRQMTERLERDIERVKDIGNYGTYISMLQILCMLTGSTSPNDIVHYKNLRLYYDNSREYYQASKRSMMIWQTYTLQAYVAICQTIYGSSQIQHPAEFYLLRTDIIQTILPELVEKEKEFKQLYPDAYNLSTNYNNIIGCLIMAYDIADQPEKAEEYIRLMEDYQPDMAKFFYISHYSYNGDFEQYSHYIQNFFDRDINIDMFGANTKRFILFGKFMAAGQKQEWSKAEQAAWEYYDAVHDYMQQNLPYFTQAEVEDFLMQQGVGGGSIQYMPIVPDIKKKQALIEKAYDINLEQKGLMLRKVDQMRQAIETSDNLEWKALLDTIQRLQREIIKTDVNQLMVNQNNEEIAKREHLFTLERQLARETKDLADQFNDTITWQEVRNSLHKGEAAIEYVTVWDACYALVLTPNCKTPQFVHLENGVAGLQDIFNILSDTTLNDIQKTEKLYGEDSELYSRLWKPIESALKGVETVYLSPTGLLNLIAFQALRIDENTFLIDKYDIQQLTTTAVLIEREQTSKSRSGKRKANVYGAIYYNELQELSPTRLAQLRREHSFNAPLLAKRLIEDAFPFLENTLYEADGIADALSSMGVLTSEKIGFAPNETEFRSLSGHSPDIIHIATHGFFIDKPDVAQSIPFFQKGGALNPMTCSGMVLANAENAWRGYLDIDSKEDNILTSAEVSELDLRNTDLVVLSACQTGVGTISPDGMFGLQRGFKQAGVHSICASLWSVADLSTSELMQTFYNYWMSGNMNMNQAMRKAMMEQRERTPAPYFWAPFILLDGID